MPKFFIIAGPNGAGKSTSAPELLSGPGHVDEFVNADVIAKEEGLSDIAAGRQTLERLDGLAREACDIAFETTLSSRSLLGRIRAMQTQGYRCHLTFFWLPSAEMAVQRVAKRVAAGGHSIPEEVIRRRYERGLENFFGDYEAVVDSWAMINNAMTPPDNRIAWRHVGERIVVADNRLWTQLASRYMKPRAEQPPAAPEIAVTEADIAAAFSSERILHAVNKAVTAALRRHKALGQSVVIWRDGKIVELKPEEIDV
jgi:predicted ABC-type ATPase